MFRYEEELRSALTSLELARAVRTARVDQGGTYRVVGERVIPLLGLDIGYQDLQSVGRAACWVAAELLDEDPNAEPWN